MSSDEDYVVNVLEERPADSGDTASKWAAVHIHDSASSRVSRTGPGSLFTVAWVLGLTLGLLWVMRNGRTVFEQWQENMQRRANRRRHGIPDNDNRPFNVAYAAAALSRRQREEEEKSQGEENRRVAKRNDTERMEQDFEGVRQRPSQHTMPVFNQRGPPAFLQGSSTAPTDHQYYSQPPVDPQIVQSHDQALKQDAVNTPQLHAHSSIGVKNSHANGGPERRKHQQLSETDDDDRLPKKSRRDVDMDIDGHYYNARENGHEGSRPGPVQVQKRGSKRPANEEADDGWEMSQDKRARKSSSDHPKDNDVDMQSNEPDEETQLVRGKKRDREDAEPAADHAPSDSDGVMAPRPSRKRRSSQEDHAVPVKELSRGRKRDRSQERSASGEEDREEGNAPTRRKRGRKLEERDEDTITPDDMSDSEAEVSSDPACGGRRVGETWEINGQTFKVGLDGRRLRHALIKQNRAKFPMPKDSAHRDANTNVEIIVEKWLNDDEYKAAKVKHELAWQDISPPSTPGKSPHASFMHQDSSGKRLLWGGPPASPVNGRISARSISNVQNPFDLAPSNAGRRVASAQVNLNAKVESPKLRNSKSFSKWEKQDLEAKSLKKMRARMEQEKAAAAAAAAKSSTATAPTPTPLSTTTNIPAQPSSKPLVQEQPKQSLPLSNTQSTTPSGNLFDKPPVLPVPGLSSGKPSSTPSNGATQPTTPAFGPTMQAAATPLPSGTFLKPSFSFNVSSTAGTVASAVGAQSAAQRPSFSFGTPTVPQSLTPDARPPAATMPTFSFGTPTSEVKKSDVPKTSFNFGASTVSAEPTTKGKESNLPPPSTSQASSGAAATIPTATNTGSFAFGAVTPNSQSNIPPKSAFTFGAVGGQKNAMSSAGAGSLLNRLGPVQDSPQASQSSAPQPSPFNAASTTPSFGTHSQLPSSNIFGGRPQVPQASSTSTFGQPGTNKPTFTFGVTPPSDAKATNASVTQLQGQVQSSNQPVLFGASAISGSDSTKGKFLAAPLSGGQEQSTSKPTLFGTGMSDTMKSNNAFAASPSTVGGASTSDTTKNKIFGAPSSTAGDAKSVFSFPKPPGQGDLSAGTAPSAFSFAAAQGVQQQQQQPAQFKPPLSFNFGAPSNATGSTAFGAPTNPTSLPSSGTPPQPGGFKFTFGQPSTPNHAPSTGFGAKSFQPEKK